MTCRHQWHSEIVRLGKAPLKSDWCVRCAVPRPGYEQEQNREHHRVAGAPGRASGP